MDMDEEGKEWDPQVETNMTTSEHIARETVNKVAEGRQEVVSTPIKRIDMGGRITESSTGTTSPTVETIECS